jgi:parvulin-like peptidyl-prolyl isomerase
MKCCLRVLRRLSLKRNAPRLSLALSIGLFAYLGGGSQALAVKKLLNKGVLTVNDEIILESDLAKFQKKLQSKSFQELFGGVDPKVVSNPDAALQLLVEEKIINQQVKKLELQASDQEIDGQIKSILKRNNITQAQLNERLKQLSTTMVDYREGIRRQIERRNLIEREIKPSLEISDEQLRHFYLRSQKPGEAELSYKIAQILIENKPKAGVPASNRATQIYTEVSAHPENFDSFVKDYSDDSSTSASGGLLGSFPGSQLSKEFRNAVSKMTVGKISKPIKTAAGFHILKLLETRADDFASLPKEKKEALKNQLVGEELEKRMALWLERKKNEAYIKKASDKDNATKLQNL